MTIISLFSHVNILIICLLKLGLRLSFGQDRSKDEPEIKPPSTVRKPVKMEVSYRPEI